MQLWTTPVALNGEQSYSGFCLHCLNNSCSEECKLGPCLTYVRALLVFTDGPGLLATKKVAGPV